MAIRPNYLNIFVGIFLLTSLIIMWRFFYSKTPISQLRSESPSAEDRMSDLKFDKRGIRSAWRNLLFLLPSAIIIFIILYIRIGLTVGFVSKNIGEGGLFFAALFILLLLVQLALIIPAFVFLSRSHEIELASRIKKLFIGVLSLDLFLIFVLPILFSAVISGSQLMWRFLQDLLFNTY